MKDMMFTEKIEVELTENQKAFVEKLAEQFGKSEEDIICFSLDMVNGNFPNDFFPTKDELDIERVKISKMKELLTAFNDICKKVYDNETQIVKAIDTGNFDDLRGDKLDSMISEIRELKDQCRDVYARLESYFKSESDISLSCVDK